MAWQIVSIAFGISLFITIGLLYRQAKRLRTQIMSKASLKKDFNAYALANPSPILGVNEHGLVIFANHGSEALLTQWKIGLNQSVPPEWYEVVKQVMLSNIPQTVELNCEKMTYLVCIVPMRDKVASLFCMDVSTFKELEQELENRSECDEETNLPNRLGFKHHLETQSSQAKRTNDKLGILVLRVDDFSQVVYTYGQEVTNAILLELSRRLTEVAQGKDNVARLSDNEFGLLKQHTGDMKTTAEYVQHVIDTCSAAYHVRGKDIFIALSIGITVCPNDGDSPDILARNAILAVNRTQSTQNQFEFYQRDLEEQTKSKTEIISELHKAVDDNQLQLVYQPQIDIQTKKLVGCEALIRWEHPQRGWISPFVFISAAEESNLILRIGEWILYQAANQINQWRSQGHPPIQVAVNLSAKQILKIDIVGLVKTIMAEYDLTPEWFALELTESALVEDKAHAIEVMQGLKNLGLELALDDFGTGYSSLSYLVQFPITKLKIDRSFILGIESEQDGKAVTKGIIDLGHSMNLKIIAEGVENDTQLNFLHDCQCQVIQGYLFGKPEPAENFERFFGVNWEAEVKKYV